MAATLRNWMTTFSVSGGRGPAVSALRKRIARKRRGQQRAGLLSEAGALTPASLVRRRRGCRSARSGLGVDLHRRRVRHVRRLGDPGKGERAVLAAAFG